MINKRGPRADPWGTPGVIRIERVLKFELNELSAAEEIRIKPI